MVMDSSEYEGQTQTLLAKTGTYRRLTKDPTMAQERKMNGLLLTLMWPGAISECLYQRLRRSAGKVPLLYGLPKVHKPGTPRLAYRVLCQLSHIRPVKACGHYPLSPLVGKSHSHVRNSFDFASLIAGQTLKHFMVMVSFDVVSLFTKVPVHLATKVVQD